METFERMDVIMATQAPEGGDSTEAGKRLSGGKRPVEVYLYTDGACSGNPGPGGWAFVMRHPATGKTLEMNGGEVETTNNRMELLAVIEGLRRLKRKTAVEVVTDSEYVGKGITSWLAGWKRNGWMRGRGKERSPVKNVELWKQMEEMLQKHHVSVVVVRGHAGHPENERCDELAVAAYQPFLKKRP